MKVLALPKDPNPYQRLLYGEMPPDVTVRFPRSTRWLFLSHPFILVACRVRGYRVIHLHWTYFLSIPVSRASAVLRCLNEVNLSFFFLLVRLLRYQIVWTAHNVTPHERQTRDDELWTRRIALVSSAVIVHSESTQAQLAGIGAATSRVERIPHGHYRGVYTSKRPSAASREKLGLPADGVIFLFFGALKRYKGVVQLIRTFTSLDDAVNVRLIIVGKCREPALLHDIETSSDRDERIILQTQFVPDEDVSTYFAAADIACLPFMSTTTSGSAILALGFGVPVLGPRLGGLAELPDTVGQFYDPDRPGALADALAAVLGDPERLAHLGEAAAAYADTLDWGPIARRTAEVYRKALSQPARR